MKRKHGSQQSGALSRRRFLGASALVLSGVTTTSPSVARGAHVAGDEMLRYGLIGCGGRGSGAAVNAMNAHPKNQLVAMADLFQEKVTDARARLRRAKPDQISVDDDHCFSGFDGYEKLSASDVDVVLIAVASGFHPRMLKAAVDAGKHVFVEKPHAVDAPGVRVVEEACRQAEQKGLSVVSGLCWRYDPGVRETVQRIHDGAIGEVLTIQEDFLRSTYRLVERRPAWDELQWQMRNWYHFRWVSGDDLVQSLVHGLDKALWVLHERTPAAAYGLGGRSSSFAPTFGDQFDHNAVIYEYDDGIRVYGFNRAEQGVYHVRSDTIVGTEGQAELMKTRIQGRTNWRYRGPKVNKFDLEHRALSDAIRRGRPINNGAYMGKSTMLAILGRMVCYTGKRLTWDDAISSKEILCPEEISWDTDPPTKPGPDGSYPVPIPGRYAFR